MTDPRRIPAAVADAVELWARGRGRHAKIAWHPVLDCPLLTLSPHPDDPRQVAFQEGREPEPHWEPVLLHEPVPGTGRFRAIDLAELGADGLVEWLDQADVTSGRGEHANMNDAIRAVASRNARQRASLAAQVEESAREVAWLHYPRLAGRPMVPGADLDRE